MEGETNKPIGNEGIIISKETEEEWRRTAKQRKRELHALARGTRILLEGTNYKQLRAGIDFCDGIAYVGVWLPVEKTVPAGRQSVKQVEELGYCLITSNRDIFLADEEELRKRGLQIEPPFQIQSRWEQERLRVFIEGDEPAPSFAEVFNEIISEGHKPYIEFRQKEDYFLDAAYTIATYYFRLFQKFGILHLLGTKDVGKTKVGDVHLCLDFNAMKTSNASAPSLFRGINNAGSTIIGDEQEGLGESKEKAEALSNIFNSGYEASGSATRVIEIKSSFKVQSYSTFSPKIVCNIQGFVFSSTESRTIPIVMLRSIDPAIINNDIVPTDPKWARIRDKLYRLALLRWQDVENEAQTLQVDGIQGRSRDIWRPILTIMSLVSKEDPTIDYNGFVEFAKKTIAERQFEGELSEPECVILRALEPLLFHNWIKLEFIQAGYNGLSENPISVDQCGKLMKKLGFSKASGEKRRLSAGIEYNVTKERFLDLCKRYGVKPEQDTQDTLDRGKVSLQDTLNTSTRYTKDTPTIHQTLPEVSVSSMTNSSHTRYASVSSVSSSGGGGDANNSSAGSEYASPSEAMAAGAPSPAAGIKRDYRVLMPFTNSKTGVEHRVDDILSNDVFDSHEQVVKLLRYGYICEV